MPLVSRVVEADGGRMLDGGAVDSIPLRAMERLGFARNVVILTQPEGFVKQPSRMLPMIRHALRKYPRLVEAMEKRHEMYNETIAYVKEQETAGACLVIRPPCRLDVKQVERDPEKLRTAYQLGREEAEKRLKEIQAFIGEESV
jgi:predicted patatin/cPLA2 family phospholipase